MRFGAVGLRVVSTRGRIEQAFFDVTNPSIRSGTHKIHVMGCSSRRDDHES